MTGIALLIGLYMAGMHACRYGAIMTGRTESDCLNATVIETCVAPIIGGYMTGIALFVGLYMGGMFACCLSSIMAG